MATDVWANGIPRWCSCSECEAERQGIWQDAMRYRFIRTHRPGDWQMMPGEVLDKAIDKALAAEGKSDAL